MLIYVDRLFLVNCHWRLETGDWRLEYSVLRTPSPLNYCTTRTGTRSTRVGVSNTPTRSRSDLIVFHHLYDLIIQVILSRIWRQWQVSLLAAYQIHLLSLSSLCRYSVPQQPIVRIAVGLLLS
jgi:hypothetical protein